MALTIVSFSIRPSSFIFFWAALAGLGPETSMKFSR